MKSGVVVAETRRTVEVGVRDIDITISNFVYRMYLSRFIRITNMNIISYIATSSSYLLEKSMLFLLFFFLINEDKLFLVKDMTGGW